MAEPELARLPEPKPELPSSVTVTGLVSDFRLTPNEMRRLKAETGRPLSELASETADEADRLQTMVWLRLRRDGLEVRWDECGDVALEVEEPAPDPTRPELSTSSPDSAATGE